jgi:phosphopantetheinyl transferase
MDTEKDKTLEQIHAATESVEKARAVPGLTPDQKYDLESASVKLWMLEQSIIKKTGDELINSLTADSEKLKELAEKIRQSAESLKEIARVLEDTAKVVEALIKIIGAVQGTGLV